jgi:glucokinase
VGIGIPAVLERDTDFVIWGPNLTGWRSVALKPELEHRINLPVYVEYDGHTAVLGEWWQGAARGYGSVAEVIIGTGIGGGLILDGRLVRGMNRLAGAAGWFALTTNAARGDDRGHAIGHWESLAAGPGIAHRAQQQLPQYPDSALAHLTNPLTAKDVFDADAQGDPLAVQIIDEMADLIGLGVANIVSVVNPEIVILGGGIGAQRGERLLPRVTEVVRRWAQPISAESVVIKPSSLGADGGLLGAAYAVLNRLSEK